MQWIFQVSQRLSWVLECILLICVSIYVTEALPVTHTHTHTHPFNGPFSGTTQVSWYQKGKTDLDFIVARDSEWQWHQLGHMQVCILLQTDNHGSTPPLCFLQARCPSCRPTNSVKALKAKSLPVNKTETTAIRYSRPSPDTWQPRVSRGEIVQLPCTSDPPCTPSTDCGPSTDACM